MTQIIGRATLLMVLASLPIILQWCGGEEDTITKCSQRGQAQRHVGGGKYTCK